MQNSNYCDSRTKEERERDSKIKVTMTSTSIIDRDKIKCKFCGNKIDWYIQEADSDGESMEVEGCGSCELPKDACVEQSISIYRDEREVNDTVDKKEVYSSEDLEDEFITFWDNKKNSLGLGNYSSDITYWWLSKFHTLQEEYKKELKELFKLAKEDINFGAEHQQMVSTKVHSKLLVLLNIIK